MAEEGYAVLWLYNEADRDNELHQTTAWVLITKEENAENLLSYEGVERYSGERLAWTDDKSSVLNALSLRGSTPIE